MPNDYTGLLSGSNWNGIEVANKPTVVTFSFPTTAAPPSYIATLNDPNLTPAAIASYTGFDAAEQTMARNALNEWAGNSGLVFIEVAPGQGDINFQKMDFSGTGYDGKGGIGYHAFGDWQFSSYPFYTSDLDSSGDVIMNSDFPLVYGTLLHEIGHSIGLKHPTEVWTNYAADPDVAHAVWDHDDPNLTIMSELGGGTGHLTSIDIQAVQSIYGTNAQDWKQVASHSWDLATQTLRQNGFAGDDAIRGTSVIDIINGVAGNDELFGVNGYDTLDGGLGNDLLDGGLGNDQVAGNGGNDTITGSGSSNILDGGNGDDSLTSSGAGDDISGGAGNDTIQAANGVADITIDGGPGTDDGFLDTIDPVPTSIENLTGGPTPEIDVAYSTKRGPRGIKTGGVLGFGVGVTGNPVITRVLTITNSGFDDLLLGGLTIPSGFTVIDGIDVGNLAPGESEIVVIGLNNTKVGTYAGTLSITSSDADEPSFDITVTGTVTLPPQPTQLQIVAYRGKGRTQGVTNGTGADFGNVFLTPFGAIARTFRFTNTGGTTLDFGRMALPKGYVATDPLVRTLAPGQTDFLTITLDTRVAGVRTGPLSFSIIGDATADVFLLNLSGIVRNPYGAS